MPLALSHLLLILSQSAWRCLDRAEPGPHQHTDWKPMISLPLYPAHWQFNESTFLVAWINIIQLLKGRCYSKQWCSFVCSNHKPATHFSRLIPNANKQSPVICTVDTWLLCWAEWHIINIPKTCLYWNLSLKEESQRHSPSILYLKLKCEFIH